MPRALRCAILVWLGASGVIPLLPNRAAAQTVLAGPEFDFAKVDFADSTLPANQDRITPDVWLTRGDAGGLFNIKLEDFFVTMDSSVISPLGTEWATNNNNPGADIESANWSSLTFGSWLNAFGGSAGVGRGIVGLDSVLRLIGDEENDLDDVYMELRFTDWTQLGGGGGFSYSRSRFPTGDYNEDGTVNAADYTVWRNTLGEEVPNSTGADGDPNGLIDEADYAFWKQHFGEDVPGGAGAGGFAAVVPEPAAALLMLIGLLSATISRKISPRGPGQNF
jgi:hypothetical protein